MKAPATLVLAAVLAAAASAEEPAPRPPLECLLLKSGRHLVGRVLEIKESRLRMEFRDGKVLEAGLSEFEPAQVYHLRARGLKDETVRQRHDLADFCVRNGLHVYAGREYERIGRMNPELADVVPIWVSKLEITEAGRLFASAWDLIAARDFGGAREKLATIVEKHPADPLAARARTFLPFASKMSSIGSEAVLDGLDEQAARLLAFVDRKAAEARDLEKTGLDTLKAGNVTKARDAVEEAEKAFAVARNVLRALVDDARTTEAKTFLSERLRSLERRTAEFYLAAAEFYIELKSWKKAKDKVERGLALDKGSKRLRALAELINKAG